MMEQVSRHRLSLAVWDVPPTVIAGERFTVKAGATSSAGVDLGGRRIEACDGAGAIITTGELGTTPWPETTALAWTELALVAPMQHSLLPLSLRLAATGLNPPHGEATYRFNVMVTPRPEHTLAIQVVTKETAAPIGDAEVRLGAYRATTDRSGEARLPVAKGRYDLRVWKVGYDAPPIPVEVGGDMAIRVEAVTVPEENADRAWRG